MRERMQRERGTRESRGWNEEREGGREEGRREIEREGEMER